jgi:hypothetical protein
MRCLSAAFLASLLIANTAYSQTADSASSEAARLDSLRSQFRVRVPPRAMFSALLVRSAPSMSANSPTAFGGSTGDAFIGASYATRARFVSEGDGVAAGGISLGSPTHAFGVDIILNSYSTVHSGFLKDAGIDFQLNRELPGNWGIALGWENPIHWGYKQINSPYAAISKWLQLKDADSDLLSAMMLTVGVGSGRFQSEASYEADRHRINVFGSVAVRVLAPLAVIADWTGQDLMVLGSVAPFARIPLVLSGGVADITRNAGDGPRVVFSGGFGFNILDWFR